MPQLIDHTLDHTHNNGLHFKEQYSPAYMCAGINYFDHVVFMSDAWAGHQQCNLCIFRDQQYKLMKVLRDPGPCS